MSLSLDRGYFGVQTQRRSLFDLAYIAGVRLVRDLRVQVVFSRYPFFGC